MDNFTLYRGDCLEILSQIEPASIDLVLTDPPYSSGGTHAGDRKASTTAKYTNSDFNGDMPTDWKAAKGTKAMPGMYHVPVVAPKQRQHQTEKPVELLEGLLAIAPADGLVLDAFMGSGSVGVACMNTGRRFVGIELNEQYYDIAMKRIREASDRALEDF